MSPVLADVLQVSALIAALALVHRPFGEYMAAVYGSKKHLRAERWIYRAVGANPDTEMRWPAYVRSVLAFSAVGVLFLYLMQRVQDKLPLSLGFQPISPDQAFNTAASFVSNTNWQSYSGESAMSHVTQTAGLAVQNFGDIHQIATLTGDKQSISPGAMASQEAIKDLGTNGGGHANANSSHPFENPNGFSNLPKWFQPRPSNSGYDPLSTGSSQLGAGDPTLVKAVRTAKKQVAEFNGVPESEVPKDAVTGSASAIDPHISEDYARFQIKRVAQANDLDRAPVAELVEDHTQGRTAGFLGEPHVNVLRLNLALKQLTSQS